MPRRRHKPRGRVQQSKRVRHVTDNRAAKTRREPWGIKR